MSYNSKASPTTSASWRRRVATSDHWLPSALRETRKALRDIAVPVPKPVAKPLLYGFVTARAAYYEAMRLLVCEPALKAYCTTYGRRVHTTAHIPWVTGKGELHLGDDVTFSGKISIKFAARYSDNPTLRIGNRCDISNGSSFVVGKSITIGDDVMIGASVALRDSNGHASDPAARKRGEAAPPDEVKPIVIQDNVWIGSNVSIGPGVTIGEGSIVAAHSVVVNSVPPYTVVSGFPARKVGALEPPPDVVVDKAAQ